MLATKRFIVSMLKWLFITTPIELVGLPVLAIVLLFTPKSAVQLPSIFGFRPFKWWDNYESYVMPHDHPDLDGLAGPDYYQERENLNLDNYFTRYYNRLYWLGIRNPANYFQYEVIGARMENKRVAESMLPMGVDIDRDGGRIYAYTTPDFEYYEYYYVIPYYKDKALRLRFGWKITSKYRPIQQFVFVVNPFFTLSP